MRILPQQTTEDEILIGEVKRRGRPRVYPNVAERSRAQREREAVLLRDLAGLKEALTQACERGRSTSLTNHLPDEPALWLPELTRRLETRKLVVCQREEKDTK